PVTSAGTDCGISPFSASVSVDLPEPDGPSRSTISPAVMSKLTSLGEGCAASAWVRVSSRTLRRGADERTAKPRLGRTYSLNLAEPYLNRHCSIGVRGATDSAARDACPAQGCTDCQPQQCPGDRSEQRQGE